jgi:hypothetical protein
MDRLLTVAEAAVLLGTTSRFPRRLIRRTDGHYPSRPGGRAGDAFGDVRGADRPRFAIRRAKGRHSEARELAKGRELDGPSQGS